MVAVRPVAAVRRAQPVIAGSVAVALFLAGCGGDNDTSSPPTSPSTSTSTSAAPSTSTSTPSVIAEVSSAYESASRAFIDAAAIPDPEFPEIAATHTGPMLEQRRDVLRALQKDGRAIRYPQPTQYRIEVEDADIDGDVATLTVCVVDDGERIEVATGRVIASGVGTVKWTAALRRSEGAWLLAERREEARWDGVAGCAAD